MVVDFQIPDPVNDVAGEKGDLPKCSMDDLVSRIILVRLLLSNNLNVVWFALDESFE